MTHALAPFAQLPILERLHVRARLFSAPLQELARLTPAGRVADIGCGHGLLTALLAVDRPDRELVAVEIDERKRGWARAALGRLSNVTIEDRPLPELAKAEAGRFDAVVVADVLYLTAEEHRAAFLAACARLLRPNGVLLLHEAAADGSWRHRKWLLQEWAMVRLLRRTQSSGGLGPVNLERTRQLLESVGLQVEEVRSMAKGYTSPHTLISARASAATGFKSA